jgi:hypothetical protein
MAGNDEAVAAVIAFAAKEDDILAIPAFQPGTGPFGNGMAGIFHEDSRRNGIYAMHSYPIHIPHLSGSSNFLHSNSLLFLLKRARLKGPDGPAGRVFVHRRSFIVHRIMGLMAPQVAGRSSQFAMDSDAAARRQTQRDDIASPSSARKIAPSGAIVGAGL